MEQDEPKLNEQVELDNLSKEEVFEQIKKRYADRSVGAKAIGSLATIFLVYNAFSGYALSLLWLYVLLGCVFELWRCKKTQGFDNPDAFVVWHDKVSAWEQLCYRVLAVVLIGLFGSQMYRIFTRVNDENQWEGLFLAVIIVAAVAYLIYLIIKSPNTKDKYIKRLRELVGRD